MGKSKNISKDQKKLFIDINKYIDHNIKDVPFLNKTIVYIGLSLIVVSLLAITIVFLVIYYS